MKLRTWIAGYFLAMLLCGINSYLTLKVGVIEEGVCITALLYAGALILMRTKIVSEELALVATMGSAGGAFGFIANFYAAFCLIGHPMSFWQMVTFSVLTSMVGLLAAPFLRQLYIVEEPLSWAGSKPAIATIDALSGTQGRKQVVILYVFIVLAFVYVFTSQILELKWTPAITFLGILGFSTVTAAKIGLGICWSPFIIGVGVWIGTRIGVGFLVAGITLTIFSPLIGQIYPDHKPQEFIWPGVSFLVSYGLTELALEWRTCLKALQSVFAKRKGENFDKKLDETMPSKHLIILAIVVLVATIIYMKTVFNIPPYLVLIMTVFGLVLVLIATRAQADSAFNPVRIMAVMLQGMCAACGGAATAINLSAAGFAAGSIGSAGILTGDNYFGRHYKIPAKQQWWLQIAVLLPIAMVSAYVFTNLVTVYQIGSEALSSPIAKLWAETARTLGGEMGSLPKYTKESIWICSIAGVLFMLVNTIVGKMMSNASGIKKFILKFTPHPLGIGLGLILPIYYSFAFFFGAILLCEIVPGVFKMFRKEVDENSLYSIASAGVVGEGIASLLGAIMIAAGIVKPILGFLTQYLPWLVK